MAKIRCVKCGKLFYTNNPEEGCPFCAEEEENPTSVDKNTIANILKILGWCILVVGFVGGIILGQNIYEYGRYEFNYVAMLISWLSCGISAVFFFALAEIIQILHDIRSKID